MEKKNIKKFVLEKNMIILDMKNGLDSYKIQKSFNLKSLKLLFLG